MANLISVTANGMNGTAKTAFTVAIPVSQIKQVTAETKGVPSALSTIYVFSSRTGGATIDYQVTINQAAVVTAANA
jgi:hypothetical protein